MESLTAENSKIKEDGAFKQDLIEKLREKMPPGKTKRHLENEGGKSTKEFKRLSKFINYA